MFCDGFTGVGHGENGKDSWKVTSVQAKCRGVTLTTFLSVGVITLWNGGMVIKFMPTRIKGMNIKCAPENLGGRNRVGDQATTQYMVSEPLRL